MLLRLVLWSAGLALGVVSLAIARDEPAFSLRRARRSRAQSLCSAPAGRCIACGLVFWRRRPANAVGPLLAAAGCAWFLAEWDNPGVGSAVVFTIGLRSLRRLSAARRLGDARLPGRPAGFVGGARRRRGGARGCRCSCSACCPRSSSTRRARAARSARTISCSSPTSPALVDELNRLGVQSRACLVAPADRRSPPGEWRARAGRGGESSRRSCSPAASTSASSPASSPRASTAASSGAARSSGGSGSPRPLPSPPSRLAVAWGLAPGPAHALVARAAGRRAGRVGSRRRPARRARASACRPGARGRLSGRRGPLRRRDAGAPVDSAPRWTVVRRRHSSATAGPSRAPPPDRPPRQPGARRGGRVGGAPRARERAPRRPKCARSSRISAPRAPASSRRATPSADGSSATFTTAPSSVSSRSRSRCACCGSSSEADQEQLGAVLDEAEVELRRGGGRAARARARDPSGRAQRRGTCRSDRGPRRRCASTAAHHRRPEGAVPLRPSRQPPTSSSPKRRRPEPSA